MTLLGTHHKGDRVTAVAPADATTIRQAVRADVPAIVRIERAAFSHPWAADAFEQFLGEPGFLVAERERIDGPPTVVGYVVSTGVRVNGRPMGHVKDIAVAPDCQGDGIGSTLLERAMSLLANRGFDLVRLEVRESNERAIELYDRFGFEHAKTHPGYYPDGEDALILHAPM